MPLSLLTPPASEPLTLAEAKAFARIETTDEDALVSSLILGARQYVEAATRRALITQGWRLTLDSLPYSQVVTLDLAPILSITAIRGRDNAGAAVPIDPSSWIADVATGRVRFLSGLPAAIRSLAGIEIEFSAGYGAASAVPEPLRHAIRLLVAASYDDRTFIADERTTPPALAALIAPYRRRSLGRAS